MTYTSNLVKFSIMPESNMPYISNLSYNSISTGLSHYSINIIKASKK